MDISAWLKFDQEKYFNLGQEKQKNFSEMIITPISRIETSLDFYLDTIDDFVTEIGLFCFYVLKAKHCTMKIAIIGTGGVVIFQLDQDFGAVGIGNFGEPHQGRVADGMQRRWTDR